MYQPVNSFFEVGRVSSPLYLGATAPSMVLMTDLKGQLSLSLLQLPLLLECASSASKEDGDEHQDRLTQPICEKRAEYQVWDVRDVNCMLGALLSDQYLLTMYG